MAKKRVVKIEFTNRWLYSILVLALILIVSGVVYAAVDKTKAWHLGTSVEVTDPTTTSLNDLQTALNNLNSKIGSSGFNGGYLFYFNNDHLGRILKNGANAEASHRFNPIYGRYDAYASTRIDQGIVKTRVRVQYPSGTILCDSGEIEGLTANCVYGSGTCYAYSTYEGVELKLGTTEYASASWQ